MNTALWILSVLLIVVGVAGTVLPALPGVILVLAGIVLGAWIDDFTRVSGLTVGIAAVLAIAAWLIEYFAGVMGAQKAGASKEAPHAAESTGVDAHPPIPFRPHRGPPLVDMRIWSTFSSMRFPVSGAAAGFCRSPLRRFSRRR